MRFMKSCLIALALLPAAAYAQVDLYEDCRTYRAIGKDARNEKERLQVISCLKHIHGAYFAYNAAYYGQKPARSACRFEKRNLNDVIDDYLAFARRTENTKGDQDVVLHILVDQCYCQEKPAAFCPGG